MGRAVDNGCCVLVVVEKRQAVAAWRRTDEDRASVGGSIKRRTGWEMRLCARQHQAAASCMSDCPVSNLLYLSQNSADSRIRRLRSVPYTHVQLCW